MNSHKYSILYTFHIICVNAFQVTTCKRTMHSNNKKDIKKKTKVGKSLLDSVINTIPFELHIPSVILILTIVFVYIFYIFLNSFFVMMKIKYQYCGPGTNLEKRLERGDPGINELDKACKQHDIAYSECKSGPKRRAADEVLGNTAWKRFKSADATVGEKLTALTVAGIMKTKAKLGFGVGEEEKKIRKSYKKPKMKKLSKSDVKKNSKLTSKAALFNTIKDVKNILSVGKPTSIKEASKLAVLGASTYVLKHKIPKKILNNYDDTVRVIPVPKIGGLLPLVPIFAGLSALGALMGGATSVANAYNVTVNAKKNLDESNEHNRKMEAIALGKNRMGEGLYLKPYKKGLGVYLTPYSKSNALRKTKNS